MIKIIRSLLLKLIYGDGAYRTFFSTGRPDEALSGKFYQHFGFASTPTKADMIVLQWGNNCISVAETDGQQPTLNDGETCLYINKNSYIRIKADGTIVLIGTGIQLGDENSSNLKKLIDERITDKLNGHTHSFGDLVCTGGTVSGSTGDPVVPFNTSDYSTSKTLAE